MYAVVGLSACVHASLCVCVCVCVCVCPCVCARVRVRACEPKERLTFDAVHSADVWSVWQIFATFRQEETAAPSAVLDSSNTSGVYQNRKFGLKDSGCIFLCNVCGNFTPPSVLPAGNTDVDPVITESGVVESVHAAMAL